MQLSVRLHIVIKCTLFTVFVKTLPAYSKPLILKRDQCCSWLQRLPGNIPRLELIFVVRTTMQLQELFDKASRFGFLTVEEAVFLYHTAPLADLMFVADELRKKQVPHGKVTWQIDRNVNTTNV